MRIVKLTDLGTSLPSKFNPGLFDIHFQCCKKFAYFVLCYKYQKFKVLNTEIDA